MKANPMYITRKIKAKHVGVETEYLDLLAREAGRCYSKTVSLIRKTHKRKGFWLSQGAVTQISTATRLSIAFANRTVGD